MWCIMMIMRRFVETASRISYLFLSFASVGGSVNWRSAISRRISFFFSFICFVFSAFELLSPRYQYRISIHNLPLTFLVSLISYNHFYLVWAGEHILERFLGILGGSELIHVLCL